jgi:hypothetical protein
MIIEGNTMGRHPVETAGLQGSPVSPIHFTINTSGLIKWVKEYVPAKELSFVDNHGRVGTGSAINQVVMTLERCTAQSIDWASRRGLQNDAAKTEEALFTPWRGHKIHLRQKQTAKIQAGNWFTWFNRQATRWLGVCLDTHLTVKEHHNRCMKTARAADATLRTLRKTYGVVPERVRAV